MKFKLPKIYPITDRGLTGLSHAEQTERLIAGGATIIQLREKKLNARDFSEDAAAALRIARARGVKLIINDRVDIALTLGADGVHVGQDDLPPDEARRILGNDAIIGFSTHDLSQAIAAVAMPLDYIAFGPIFETTTKENPDDVVGLDGLKEIRKALGEHQLVAIGGIDEISLAGVFDAGASSVAMIGAILRPAENIAQNLSRLSRRAEDC